LKIKGEWFDAKVPNNKTELNMENIMEVHEITPVLHLCMILFVIIFAALITIAGIRMKHAGRQELFSKWFGIYLFCIWVAYTIYSFLPANFRADTSLPIEVCDVLAVIAALALIKPNRKTRAVLYFCALALAGQAIITPNGNQDPMIFRFWLFWFLHAGILSASIYDIIVRKYRPVFKDYLFVILCDLIYVVVILPLDIVFGWNYGFIGNQTPDSPTLIDALGPWPQRLIWLFAIVFVVQFIMYLPWKLIRRKNKD